MARPRDREEAKTDKLNMRVTPSFKARLDAVARIAGKPSGSWAEERLVQIMEDDERSAGTTDATKALLNNLERHIFEIEQATGTPWHQGLGTWAAVREMLNHGPIMAVAPEAKDITAKLTEISEKQADITNRRAALIEALQILGIDAKAQDTAGALLASYMFGGPAKTDRDVEREQIEARTDLPEQTRTSLLERVDELERLDNEALDLQQRRAEALEPLREAIDKGRATYARPNASLGLEEALALFNAAMPKPPTRRGGMFGA